MKKVSILIMLLVTALIVESVFAANTRDGRRKFRKNCYQMCHKGKDGKTEVIAPNSLTSDKWAAYFANNNAKLKKMHVNGELEKVKLNEEDLFNIGQYLLEHALDSKTPETCG